LVETKIAGLWTAAIVIVEPDRKADWKEARRKALQCKCAIFCWSDATSKPEARAMTILARRVLEKKRAIAVELNAGARPAVLAGCTTYPLHDWRARPRIWHRFVFGNRFVTQIAAAAQQKVLGRDPPPPSAYASLVRAQAWMTMVGLAAVLGFATSVLEVYRDPRIAKLIAPRAAAAFEAARIDPKPCDALRTFGEQHTGSAWSQMASELLATCTTREIRRIVPSEQRLEAFGATKTEADSDGARKCATYASNSGAIVRSVRIENFTPGERATVVCTLDQPVIETIETLGSAAR
jgi:hypothetical protein